MPHMIKKINDMSEELQKKRRQKLQLKTDKNNLKKTIDNLLKKLVLESTTDYLVEDSKNEEAVEPNNVPETSLMNSDITSQMTIKVTPEKVQPIALFKTILEKSLVDNKTQPTIQINLNTQVISESYSSIISKQDLQEKYKNPLKKVLPDDDELLPFQRGRVSPIKKFKRKLDEEILPHYKVFVMDQQKTPKDAQKQGDDTRLNSTNLPTESQQSTTDVQETLLNLNPKDSQNQKSPSIIQRISKKYQKRQKQRKVVKSDSLKNTHDEQSIQETELTETDKNKRTKIIRHQSKTQAAGTSRNRSAKVNYNSVESQTEITGKAPSKFPPELREFKTMASNASKEQELIVLKLPEEMDCHDEFIPPVALKKFAKNANIIQIEELLEDETDDDKTEEAKQKLQQIGEAFETGEWFETATMHSKSDSILGLSTNLTRKINVSISSSAFYSKCLLPCKESSESHLLVSRDAIKALKNIKSSQRKSSSGFVAALDKVKYLDRYDSPDDFDETFKQFLEIKPSVDTQESTDKKKVPEDDIEGIK